MAENLQNQLKEVGSKLEKPPAIKDDLIKILTQAASSLSDLDQSPPKALMESMRPLLNAIVKPKLLKHEDQEVQLLVATCTCEITRITAPEAPYDDDVLKDIFHLFVSTFNGLRDTKGPSFERRVLILDTVAKYRSFVVMLDLECDDLVNEMFKTFFAVASDEHSESVVTAMETIMAVLLEESEDIREDLLLIVLSNLGRHKNEITAAARRLAMSVIGQCAEQLEPGIKKFIVSSMSGDSSPLNPHIDYHEVIYDVYRCAPQALSQIVPYLTKELLTDSIDLRLKAVRLVGDLFSIKGSTIHQTFHPIFTEFMKSLSAGVVEIRMSVLENINLCLLSDPFRAEAPELVAALCDKLSDCDESIRKQVVAVISDVSSQELSSISADTIKLVAERLHDKSLLVKKYTMERLSNIYRTWCLKQTGGLTLSDDYDWIPGQILRCFHDKEVGPDSVEHILCASLIPVEFSVKDKVKTWVRLISKFDKVEVKALEKILEQKQRSQLELQKYLSLRQIYKESDASELQKKMTLCIRSMSQFFIHPGKAEADFLLLDQLSDANIWKILTTILDPNTSSLQSRSLRDELLKIVGKKHPVYELLSTLSTRCSYITFDKDFVKDLLLETDLQKSSGNKLLTQSCMNILVILASFSPLLLSGIEEDLVHLLEDDDDAIKEGVLHVLAKAGETIREQLGERESSSTLDLLLERICLEGSRRQAKYAVHALAAVTKDDGLKSLSVLYKRLVEMLEKRTKLPSVLQSLGCIAQMAMPVFETQESKIEGFIRKDILRSSQKTGGKVKESWDDRSELCSLKIFGIKTLVKSYLPVKDAHLRLGIDELLKDLHNILSFGEISEDVESSSVDKAHLKLASAKAIIRLSKHWDKQIPIDTFHLTLRTAEVGFPEVRKLFLKKVHQYIKNRSLDPKYVCAFLLDFNSQKSIADEENPNLVDILQMPQQGTAEQFSSKNDGNSAMVDPVYILPYLVHALAHHPSCPNIDECKDAKAYEPIYWKLYTYFSKLALGGEDGKPGVSLKREDIISIISVLRNIKSSKDAVDKNISKNSYAICDLCLSIMKHLAQKQEDLDGPVLPVSLPEVLYTSHKKKEENKEGEQKDENKEDEKKEENKEEVEAEVTEGQTWLASESALAHFEVLILEANGSVPSKNIEDDILKDSETDGNEMPLGKMLKRLKAKGSKAKKAVKNGSTPAVVETENNVDILGMLREINSDNMSVPTKFDSINGHGKLKSGVNLKRKGTPSNLANVSVPKRRRSSSAKGHKRLSFLSGFKGGSAFNNNKMDDDPHSVSEDKVALKGITTEPTHLDGGDAGIGIIQNEESINTDEDDLEKPKKMLMIDSNKKSGPIKKRKRRRISGLARCTSDETEANITDLIGRRIKVWWPMDKEFYEGVVKSYNHHKKKHEVLYDDGDIEVLCLDKERWELVENEHKPTKRKQLSDSPSSKGGSSKKKNKSSGSSKQIKETDISPSSMVRGKRTPRKNLKQGQKGVSQRSAYFEMGKSKDSDLLLPEAKPPLFSKVDNLDEREGADELLNDRQGGSSAGKKDTGKVEKSRSKEKKQMKDAESSSSDAVSSQENESDSGQKETKNIDTIPGDGSGSDENNESPEKEKQSPGESDEVHHKSDSGGNQDDGADSHSMDAQTPDRKGSTSDESHKAEFSDDEPLGVWKSRVGKSVKGK